MRPLQIYTISGLSWFSTEFSWNLSAWKSTRGHHANHNACGIVLLLCGFTWRALLWGKYCSTYLRLAAIHYTEKRFGLLTATLKYHVSLQESQVFHRRYQHVTWMKYLRQCNIKRWRNPVSLVCLLRAWSYYIVSKIMRIFIAYYTNCGWI
jgi:hypothetical protein